jgi:hypothetical protein
MDTPIKQHWNDASRAHHAIDIDIDAEAYAAGSSLLNIKINGQRKLQIDLTGELIAGGGESVTALTSTGGALVLDASLTEYCTHTMTEDTTLSIINPPTAGTISLRIKQHASAAKTMALPGALKPTADSDTAIGTDVGGYTLLVMTTYDAGARWEYVMLAGG